MVFIFFYFFLSFVKLIFFKKNYPNNPIIHSILHFARCFEKYKNYVNFISS
jgi:hypothetical protein